MTYEHAETAQEIARLLRLRTETEHLVITAPRQSGKTVELLKYAEEKCPNGKFSVLCMNQLERERIVRCHWRIFNRVSFADMCAARLLGNPLGLIDVSPPLVITPDNIDLLRGHSKPIFVDEWDAYDGTTQSIILRTGLFAAAVTS